MHLIGCEALRRATEGCRIILLSATEGEAELLYVAMLQAERRTVAGKAIYVGQLEIDHAGYAEASAAGQRDEPHPRPSAPVPTVRAVLGITGCDKANAAHLLTCLLQAMEPPPQLVLQMGIAGALPSPGPGPGAAVGDLVIATQEAYIDTGSSSPGGWLSAAELGLPIACANGRELAGTFPLDAELTLAAHDLIERVEWPESARAGVSNGEPTGNGHGALEAHPVSWPAAAGRSDRQPAVLLGPCVTSSLVTGVLSDAQNIGARWGALAESMEGAAAAHMCALYGVPFLEIRGISNLVTDRDRDSWQVRRAAAVAGWATLAVVAAIDRLPLSRTGSDARI